MSDILRQKPKYCVGASVWILEWLGRDKDALTAQPREVKIAGYVLRHSDYRGEMIVGGYIIDEVAKHFDDTNVFDSQEQLLEAIEERWYL